MTPNDLLTRARVDTSFRAHYAAQQQPVNRALIRQWQDWYAASHVMAHGRGQPGMLAYDERERVRGSGGR